MAFKNIKSIFCLIILLVGIFFCEKEPVHASVENMEISLDVEQIFEIQNGISQSVDQSGSYELQAVSTGTPMPEGSEDDIFSFTMKGKKDLFTIRLEYNDSGIYKYRLRQTSEEKENYDFDRACYSVTVYIAEEDGVLIPQMIVQNENGKKCGKIQFHNVYNEKREMGKHQKNTQEYAIQNQRSVETGDITDIGVWTFCIAVSGFVIVTLLYRKKGKCK